MSPNVVDTFCGAEPPASRTSPNTLVTTSGARVPTISTGGRVSEGRSATTPSSSARVAAS